jgi:photosystem II stability/assembly factor-like uncharacterized protein
VFAGTQDQGGVYKSTDGGGVWSLSSRGLVTDIGTIPEIYVLAVDPDDPMMVYAGTAYGGLFRSTDGGENWASFAFNEESVTALAINPLNAATMYAGIVILDDHPSCHVYKSTDAGGTWTDVSQGLPGSTVNDLVVSRMDTSLVLAAAGGGVYESPGGWGPWNRLDGGWPQGDNVVTLAVDPLDAATIYAGLTFSGVYRSTDGGGNWVPINDGLEDHDGQVSVVNDLAVNRDSTQVLYAGTEEQGIFRSTNRGDSWEPYNDGLYFDFRGTPPVNAILLNPGGTLRMLVGTGDMILCASGVYGVSGVGWEPVNEGLRNVTPLSIAFDPGRSGRFYVGTRDNGIFRTTDGGGTWEPINDGISFPAVQSIVLDPRDSNTLYAGTGAFGDGAGVFKSTDGGDTWQWACSGACASIIYDLAIDPITPDTLYAGTEGRGVIMTQNGAMTWQTANVGLLDTMIGAITISPQDHLTVSAGGWIGKVYKSTNAGASWQLANDGLPDYNYSECLYIRPDDPETVYLAESGLYGQEGIYVSTDAGQSWQSSSEGLVNSYGEFVGVFDLGVDPSDAGILFAGTNWYAEPLSRSTDAAGSWHPYATDIYPAGPAAAVGIDPFQPAMLYAGVFGFGLMSIDETQVGIGNDGHSPGLPLAWSLDQNYPNPFNPMTTVTFKVPSGVCGKNRVDISVFDIRGHLVKRLVNAELGEGRYEVVWDGTDLNGNGVSSGVYIYRLEAAGSFLVRKMVISR